MSRDEQNIKTTDWLTRGMTEEEIAKEKEEAIKEAEAELRDKQIEEIVKDFCPLYQEYGSCKRCDKDLNIDGEPCYYGCVANLIIDYDYRKASEVAEEIFEEIEQLYMEEHEGCEVIMSRYEFARLKKKYKEGEYYGTDSTSS